MNQRVLLTTDYLPPSSGGVERVVTELALHLSNRDHEVTVLALDDCPPELKNTDVDVYTVRSIDLTGLLGVQARVAISFVSVLIQLFSHKDFDIVHSHNRFFFSTWMTACVCALHPNAPPLVTTVHLGNVSVMNGLSGTIATSIEKTIGRFVFRQSTAIIAVSQAAANAVEHLIGDTDSYVIHNGVDTADFSRTADAANVGADSANEVTILFVGRLIDNKGPMKLLKAVAGLNRTEGWRVHIVGTGPLAETCERFVATNDLSGRVIFRGFVESVAKEMRIADIFCRPSQTEGLPLTLLEAMSSGLVPVVTPAGGVSEVVKNGENGVLVTDDPTDIRTAIERLIHDREYHQSIATAARKTVEDGYSWDRRAERVADIYRRISGGVYQK